MAREALNQRTEFMILRFIDVTDCFQLDYVKNKAWMDGWMRGWMDASEGSHGYVCLEKQGWVSICLCRTSTNRQRFHKNFQKLP